MNDRDSLPVDLADPEDIRAKLPLARQYYREKQRELAKLEDQVDSLADLVSLLSRLAGEDDAEPQSIRAQPQRAGVALRVRPATIRRKRAPGQEKAAKALELAGRPMGPAELYRFMTARDLDPPANPNALGANLWAAANAKRIKRSGEGQYAPLDWEPDNDDELFASQEANKE